MNEIPFSLLGALGKTTLYGPSPCVISELLEMTAGDTKVSLPIIQGEYTAGCTMFTFRPFKAAKCWSEGINTMRISPLLGGGMQTLIQLPPTAGSRLETPLIVSWAGSL